MSNYSLVFPEGFDDYAWEVESKGWFGEARLLVSGVSYRLTFYDPVRLAQEIADELRSGGVFFEPNLVIVQSVTRQNMEMAVDRLMDSVGARALVVG